MLYKHIVIGDCFLVRVVICVLLHSVSMAMRSGGGQQPRSLPAGDQTSAGRPVFKFKKKKKHASSLSMSHFPTEIGGLTRVFKR